MDRHAKYARQAAAAAFSESLDQLEERLLSDDLMASPKSTPMAAGTRCNASQRRTTRFQLPQQPSQYHHLSDQDLQAFADAAEEIEKFIQARR